jgi:hypothetical protein
MLRPEELHRDIILKNLTNGICKVIFKKVTDGRFRSMLCTLNPDYVPMKFEKGIMEVFKSEQDDIDLVPVFDIIHKDWRSFRIRTIQLFYTPEELNENKEVTQKKQKEKYENSDKREQRK